MDWQEITISTTSVAVEMVCAVLLEQGVTGVRILDDFDTACFLADNPAYWDYADDALIDKHTTQDSEAKIIFYLPMESAEQSRVTLALKALSDELGGEFNLGSLSVETKNVNDATWLDEWRKYYKPFRISKGTVVIPVGEIVADLEVKDGDVFFRIDPGHVFGTGLHQSTSLCVDVLEKVIMKETGSVLDIGTGSGILGIIALLYGAKNVVATDIDPAAIKSSADNAKLNNVLPRFYPRLGNIMEKEFFDKIQEKGRYSIVFANIIADVIIDISNIVSRLLTPTGIFIASGIINGRRDDVLNAMARNGLHVIEVFRKDEWICVAAKTDAITTSKVQVNSPIALALFSEMNAEMTVRAQCNEPFTLLWVIRVGGKAAGCVACLEENSTYALNHAFIRPLYRGRGLFSTLLAAVEAQARDSGVNALTFDVPLSCEGALDIVTRKGFTEVRRGADFILTRKIL